MRVRQGTTTRRHSLEQPNGPSTRTHSRPRIAITCWKGKLDALGESLFRSQYFMSRTAANGRRADGTTVPGYVTRQPNGTTALHVDPANIRRITAS